MDAKACCDGMSAELIGWKSKMDEVIHKFDAASCGEKQWVFPYINDLHIIRAELDDKIRSFKTECPMDGEPVSEEPERKLGFLGSGI